jgi:hypothetical protein
MYFNQGFIGYLPNQSLKFLGTDTEEIFRSNLKSLPTDWYYRTADITYNHNSLGHRSPESDTLNLDNYILFTGCSHTQGSGLELEKTYPYIVADSLGCDYYNLALGSTGIDAMIHNLSLWLAKVNQKPWAIVVQWPDEARFQLVVKRQLRSMGSWTKRTHISRFLTAGSYNGFFSSRKKIASEFINSFSDHIKIINVGINFDSHTTENMADTLCMPLNLDRARDLEHFGIISNQVLAKNITTRLNK